MAKSKGTISIAVDRCKGCGLCTVACLRSLIFIDKNRLNAGGYSPASVRNMDKCIGCTDCALMCPDYAITVERMERNRADMRGK
jgi:2-oxoglutarate ferredoxin oxidoreductase subunit delta